MSGEGPPSHPPGLAIRALYFACFTFWKRLKKYGPCFKIDMQVYCCNVLSRFLTACNDFPTDLVIV